MPVKMRAQLSKKYLRIYQKYLPVKDKSKMVL